VSEDRPQGVGLARRSCGQDYPNDCRSGLVISAQEVQAIIARSPYLSWLGLQVLELREDEIHRQGDVA